MKILLYTLFLFPLVQAWTFRYTNATNNATILHQNGALNCTEIDLAGGKLFSWDPEGSRMCVLIFYDAKCLHGAGISCPFWKKPASRDFYGVKIVGNEETASVSISKAIRTSTASPTSVSTSASTSSSSSATPTPAVTASTTPAANRDSSSGSSLSGGAITGIVIGVVCAVLIIAVVFFSFGRRQKQNAILANQQNGPQGPYGPNTAGRVEADVLTSSRAISEKPADSHPAGRPAPGSRFVELAGHDRAAELANSSLHELDARHDRESHRF